MNTDVLFQPIQIGNVELKNRIAMSPMNMGYTGPNGYASEQTNAWYATRAGAASAESSPNASWPTPIHGAAARA